MTDQERLANLLKESNDFETVALHWLDSLEATTKLDPRWKSIAKTHFEEGFMAVNKSICGGGRTKDRPVG